MVLVKLQPVGFYCGVSLKPPNIAVFVFIGLGVLIYLLLFLPGSSKASALFVVLATPTTRFAYLR
jgi:hypothetical protein